MATFLITYDLGDKTKEDDLLEYLDGIDAILVTESCYFVSGKLDTSDIKDAILDITKKIRLAVFAFGTNAHVSHYNLENEDELPWK